MDELLCLILLVGVTIKQREIESGIWAIICSILYTLVKSRLDPKRYKKVKLMGSWLSLGQCDIAGQWKKRSNAG